MRLRLRRFSVSACLMAAGSLGLAQAAFAQPVPARTRPAPVAEAAEAAADAAAEAKAEGAEEAKEDMPEESAPPKAAVPQNPKLVVLHLQDGSIITGEMEVNALSVETEFGELEIPLAKIRSISPGLGSSPELSAKVQQMIEDLGSDDYKAREQAHKDLAAMGLKVQNILEQHRNDENAERKRHVTEILKEFEELAMEQAELMEDGGEAERPLIVKDTVVTQEFTIVGKISPDKFKVSSKYGPLTVQLADLKRAERPQGEKESIRKLVQVPGDNLVQRSFKNSGIRVEAGDKISIRADGSVVMSPWGSDQTSGPDGAPNFGWYIPNQIYGGCLVAKIGDKGQVFKVGSRHTVVAKQSGTLQFAVAMQHQYSQQGYSYPGNYNVRVTVEGK